MANERRVLEVEDGILSEASKGQKERARLNLDNIDRTDQVVTVKITSPVVTSSFIRGFIGPSAERLGYQKFVEKYEFDSSPSVKSNILANARYAWDLKE